MRKVVLDKEFVLSLKKSLYIKEYNHNRLEYTNEFKVYCIMSKLANTNLTAESIFRNAGIDTSKLHPDLPRQRIYDWMRLYNKFGLEYFINA